MRGGSSIRALDDIFEFTGVTNYDWTHPGGLTSWWKDNKAQQEQLPPLFTPSSLPSSPLGAGKYAVPPQVSNLDRRPHTTPVNHRLLLKAVKMSAQQVGVPSTERNTFVACVGNHPSAEERLTRWRARPTDMRAQPVSRLGSKTISSHPHLIGVPLQPLLVDSTPGGMMRAVVTCRLLPIGKLPRAPTIPPDLKQEELSCASFDIRNTDGTTDESNLAPTIAPVVTRKGKQRMLHHPPTPQESRQPPPTAPPGAMPTPTRAAPPPRTQTRK